MPFKVLYVEDNANNMQLVRKMLKMTDYVLIEAVDGLSGYEAALREQPDMIIMDIGLPDVNGVDIVYRLQQTPESRHIPVVALTANISEEMMRECMIAGCKRVLHKPISRFVLLDVIRMVGRQPVAAQADTGQPGDLFADELQKVLIVEDNPDLRIIFARAFDPHHYTVLMAEDGITALEILEAELPDAMILDINMPRLSGLDVLRSVRNNQQMKHVKIIVVTGNSRAAQSPEADYADLFLMKPIDIGDLISLAQRLISAPI
jgi:CheY-like chemotaxis protein